MRPTKLHTHIEIAYSDEIFAYIFVEQIKKMNQQSVENMIFYFPSHSSGLGQFFDVGLIWSDTAYGDEFYVFNTWITHLACL